MTAKQSISSQVKDLLSAQNALNSIVAEQLQMITAYLAPESPNYRRELIAYSGFDWSDIGAYVIAEDNLGPTLISFGNHVFKRRSGNGKFGNAVWYSRPIGQDDSKTVYARLITFKEYDPVEPLAFNPEKKGKPTASDKPPAANGAPMKYGDGSIVPNDPRTQRIFKAYHKAHKREIPHDSAALKEWFKAEQEKEAK